MFVLCALLFSTLTLFLRGNLLSFFCRLLIFIKSTFSNKSFRNTISVKLNGPRTGSTLFPNCFNRLLQNRTVSLLISGHRHDKEIQCRKQNVIYIRFGIVVFLFLLQIQSCYTDRHFWLLSFISQRSVNNWGGGGGNHHTLNVILSAMFHVHVLQWHLL